MGNDTQKPRDVQQELHRSRRENFANLRSAVQNISEITDVDRDNLVAFMEKIEVKTLRDGFCYLTREELATLLYWSVSKFDRYRRLAERLKWVTVNRRMDRGGQQANAIKPEWNRIKRDASKPVSFAERDEEAPLQDEHPYKEEFIPPIIPKKNPSKNPIHHEPNGVLKKLGGWDEPIELSQMSKIDWCQKRYLEAVEKGWLVASDINQIYFFALSRACLGAEGIDDPPAFFTSCLRKQNWKPIRHADEEAARKAVRSLRQGQKGCEAFAIELDGLGLPKGKEKDEQLRELAAFFQKQTDGQ